jgi:hypothetical protein
MPESKLNEPFSLTSSLVIRRAGGTDYSDVLQHAVVVHDMYQPEVASRGVQHGIRSLPAVAAIKDRKPKMNR